MPLIDQVKTICDRLAPLGWRQLILDATQGSLDLQQPSAAALRTALTVDLPMIDRSRAGFADFCPAAPARGLAAGSFARSVLYHALASPLVHPSANAPAGHYPSIEELDTVENLIFALQPFRLADFLQANPAARIVVFAYQYRTGGRSPHRRYADMAWSRTGVSRTGVVASVYDPARRSWRPSPAPGDGRIAVLPARYGAWLAIPRSARQTDVIMDARQAQRTKVSLWPVRKIFPGKECLADAGFDVTLSFSEFHINEKLRSIHRDGGIGVAGTFDLDAAPFVRTSLNEPGLVTLQTRGASAVVIPKSGPLVEVARQGGKIARFTVPAQDDSGEGNRFAQTSLLIPAPGDFRIAPEYVNIRHEFIGDGQTPRDLAALGDAAYFAKIDAGGYDAAHYLDHTCDGAVLAKVRGIGNAIPTAQQLPAFSLVTAPDFLPMVDQSAVFRWTRGLPDLHFAQGGPEPLSRGDTPASQDVFRPGTQQRAFATGEVTMTYVTGLVENPGLLMAPELPTAADDAAVSWLTDAASNVFAPGWDVSRTRKGNSAIYLSSRGLGSPFPEDAKLCAMLNSFWPAVAPDAARTFGRTPTGIPLLDTELGLHPRHPAVAAGAVSGTGWDGEFGPFFEATPAGRMVNHASLERSDYVSNGLANTIQYRGLDLVSTPELIVRMESLRACIRSLPPGNDNVPTSRLLLVQVERVADWAARADRLSPQVAGPGLLFVFARITGAVQAGGGEPSRLRRSIDSLGGQPAVFTCQLVTNATRPTSLAWKQDGGGVHMVPL